jgi:nucleosome binding factor SPN SPT16 subunit
MNRDSILIPVGDTHVPFHVSVLKNISKLEEGKYNVIISMIKYMI